MAPRRWNPVAFTPAPVAVVIAAIYIALLSTLITIHNVVPAEPASPTPTAGINLTEAWVDLQRLTNGYHPYNSRRNDDVRRWLLGRIEAILKRNGAAASASGENPQDSHSLAVVFDDVSSNLTFGSSDSDVSVAFTGTNIMVYIRGTEDEPGAWWLPTDPDDQDPPRSSNGGVLVNAHFDSVPSGFGATDDGVGVVTILQLISYFTTKGNQPTRGVLALLNNGEEDYLNGAYAFTQHSMSKFPHTFLNLEGAGAGGRAVLFRSSDTEVTRFYSSAPHPFGTVISADGFKRHLVRSQTDYVVFDGLLGMRGLDVAFMEPRSRYHTSEDSTRFTSKRSLWHMLSAALETTKGLSSDTSSQFTGDAKRKGMVNSGQGTEAVWFDLFGSALIVFELHTLFAISVTLIVVAPLILLILTIVLAKVDKLYIFSSQKVSIENSDLATVETRVRIDGWKAFFRTPVVFVAASAAAIGTALLINKANPYIVYSSEYAVWSTMLCIWFSVAWFLLRGADFMRPSALHRMYSLMWLFAGAWLLLVADTVLEHTISLAGGYFLVFYFAAIFLALVISYLELFALPKKTVYANLRIHVESSTSIDSQRATAGSEDDVGNDHDGVTESTSLLRGDGQRSYSSRYGAHRSNTQAAESEDIDALIYQSLPRPYGNEQPWSGKMPSWTWLLQFLILGPVMIVLLGQVALLMTSALHQTPADGSSTLTVYLFVAVLSVLLLAPITPFIHRLPSSIPRALFLVFIGTLLYNLLAFPFSDQARLKAYFVQSVNLDSGINQASLTGLPPYVQSIVSSLPSAAGQSINCASPEYTSRNGLQKCSWTGLPPNVVATKSTAPGNRYASWVAMNATRKGSSVQFRLSGKNTRACRLLFDRPIGNYTVDGYVSDERFPAVGPHGCRSIRLWSREWGGSWTVRVGLSDESANLEGSVVCLWSDANEAGTIPAYDELLRYMPAWSTAIKLSDGLVEGFRRFSL